MASAILLAKRERKMEWLHTISTIVATLIMLGASFKFMWSRLDKKFEDIDKKFEAVDRKFDLVIQELKEIKLDIRSLEQRVARLETQDEERFRNDIKVFMKEKATH